MPKYADLCAVNAANIEQKQISKSYWWYPIKQTIKYILDLLPFRFLFFFRRCELFLNCLKQTENLAADRQNLEEADLKTLQFGLKFSCVKLFLTSAHFRLGLVLVSLFLLLFSIQLR